MRLFPRQRAVSPTVASTPLADRPPATLDLIYVEIKARLQESSAQAASLDTKAGFVLTAASLLITVATGAQATVATHHTPHILAACVDFWRLRLHPRVTFMSSDAMHGLMIIAALIYTWVVVFAWRAYTVRKFKIISPEILYDYIDPKYTEEWQVKKMLVHAMRDQYSINQEKIDLKSHQVELALRGFLVEVLFLALILLLLIFL